MILCYQGAAFSPKYNPHLWPLVFLLAVKLPAYFGQKQSNAET